MLWFWFETLGFQVLLWFLPWFLRSSSPLIRFRIQSVFFSSLKLFLVIAFCSNCRKEGDSMMKNPYGIWESLEFELVFFVNLLLDLIELWWNCHEFEGLMLILDSSNSVRVWRWMNVHGVHVIFWVSWGFDRKFLGERKWNEFVELAENEWYLWWVGPWVSFYSWCVTSWTC